MTNNEKSVSMSVCFVYILPFIIGGYLYFDDFFRFPGPYGWDHNGRYLSTAIVNFIGNGRILNINPFSTIAGVLSLCLSGFFLTKKLFNNNDSFTKVLASTSFVISPFFLDNMAYQYDVLPMSMAVSLAVVSFCMLCAQRNAIYTIPCLLLLLLSISAYQSSVNVFASGVALYCIKMLFDNYKLNEIVKKVFISSFVFLLAVFIYKAFIFNPSIATSYTLHRSEMIPFSMDALPIIKKHYLWYSDIFKDLFHGPIGKLLMVFYASPLLCLAFQCIINRTTIIRSMLVAVLYVIIAIMSVGFLMILKNPPYQSRAMISAPIVTIAAIFIISRTINNYSKFILWMPLFSSFIFCSSFYMMQKISNDTYKTYAQLVNSIANTTSRSYKNIYIYYKKIPVGMEAYKDAMPFIYRMNPRYFDGDIVIKDFFINNVYFSALKCDSECAAKIPHMKLLYNGKSADTYIKDSDLVIAIK